MKNTIYKKANLTKLFFTLIFGLSSILSFGQPDPPPVEVPLDSNIMILFSIAILFAAFFFIRNFKTITNQKLEILKKTTSINKVTVIAFLTMLLNVTTSTAQLQSGTGTLGTNLYVHNGGEVFVQLANNVDFGTSSTATTGTTRTAGNYGKISFASTTTWSNATNTHSINGYARRYGTTDFIFPIGYGATAGAQTSVYGAAKASSISDALGVDAAYYGTNPATATAPITLGAAKGTGVASLDTVEFWHILRASGTTTNAKISLTWRSASGVSTLTSSNLSNLTIVAWDGSKWISIASAVDGTSILGGSSTLTAGSITTSAVVNLGTYQYFTLAGKTAIIPVADTLNIPVGGGTSPNIAGNDTINGSPVTLGGAGNATIAQAGTWPAGVTLDPLTGIVTVDPLANVPMGTYPLSYTLCDKATPTPNCATTTSVLNVDPKVNPVADTLPAVAGGASPSVVANDTINGAPATLGGAGNAVISQVGTWPAGLTLNTTTGAVNVPPGTPAGTYPVTYKLCDKAPTPNCSTVTSSVTVGPAINPVADNVSAPIGGTTPSVLANDSINGVPATDANSNISLVGSPTGITINPDGTINVGPGAVSGPVTYQLCDLATPTPNCATNTVNITVSPNVNPVAETVTAEAGGIASPSILANDTINDQPITLGNAGNATVAQSGAWPSGITLDPATGAISVAAGTAPGTYPVAYQLCDKATPTPNCNIITSSVVVTAKPCMPDVTPSGTTKTWNGTAWSPSAPTEADPVVLTGNYSGNLTCNSLAMGAFNVTLANGELLEVVRGVTGTGKVIMSSEASVVQRVSGAAAPSIELTKTSRNVMHWRDYMYYGTPISGNFYSQIASNTWNTGFATTFGSFDLSFNYVVPTGWNPLPAGGVLTNPAVQTNAAFTVVTGKGFISRIKQNAPWTAGSSTSTPTFTGQVNFKFVGTANNGDLTVAATSHATKMELLANPYPSGVDAQKFLTTNTNVAGSIYLWTAGTIRTCASGSCTYAGADYAQWNLAGATNTSPISTKIDGKIASGQGFRARLSSGASVLWNNCMRITTGNNNFFRQAQTVVDRFNLNVQDNNDAGIYNQILVAYLPEATNDFDRLYDGEKYSTSPTQLYTLLNGQKLGINGRGSFVESDVVPMGLSNTTAEQSFTISIENKEGVFATNEVYVFIHDKEKNIYHDMTAPFVFNTNNAAEINNRFEIVYQRNANSTDYLANEVVLNIKDNVLTAKAFEVGMVEITIFDITGRKVQTIDANNSKSVDQKFNHSEGIYIAKVKLANGSVSTQKLINKK